MFLLQADIFLPSDVVRRSEGTGWMVELSSPIPASRFVSHLGHDVNAAQQQLVQVAALHQLRALDESVFEARPDFPPQLRGDVQPPAQVPQTHAGQVVHLQTQRGRWR